MPVTADYIRIADDIAYQVRAGRLRADGQLPSISQLAAKYGVSQSTIKQVYVRLEALRVIRRHQGKGVFVNDPKLWMREP
ncbi:winged helix-turn-helix domain-containing protein [Micromonospora sp. L32]|uniref:winged helix-turn-helix domain-containing protein n=1 Tax=Micromonospora sp. L32 TaxID=3452214 RepID=UPI003F8B49B1